MGLPSIHMVEGQMFSTETIKSINKAHKIKKEMNQPKRWNIMLIKPGKASTGNVLKQL